VGRKRKKAAAEANGASNGMNGVNGHDVLDDPDLDDEIPFGADDGGDDAAEASDADPGLVIGDDGCVAYDDVDDAPDEATAATEPAPATAAPATKASTEANAPPGTRYLKCRLSPKERGALSKKLRATLRSMRAKQDHIEELRLSVRNARKELDVLETRVHTIAREADEGTSFRYVQCEEREEADPSYEGADEAPRGKGTYRLDTNERIEWRALNRDERQGVLFHEPSHAGHDVTAREATV
jgi:hypothetical protein